MTATAAPPRATRTSRAAQQRSPPFVARARAHPVYLTQPKVETLLAAAPSVVARTLILVQWRAGLRISKALAPARRMGAIPVEKAVSPHTLRHSAAIHWLACEVPINVVSQWLGHKDLQTTLIYLQFLPDPAGSIGRVS